MALADSYSRPTPLLDVVAVKPIQGAKPRQNNTALQYQRAQIETASPTRLVILLYEGAIRFCQLALEAMAQQNLPAQHVNLLKAQAIVAELLSSLNRDKGGDVAENLARLYTHILEQLVSANLYDQAEPVKVVQDMLRDLRASWVEIERSSGGGEEQGEEEKPQSSIHNPQSTIGVRQPTIAVASRLGNRNA